MIYNKLLIFAHDIKPNARSLFGVQSSFNLPITLDVPTEDIRTKKVEISVIPQTNYET